MSNINKINKIGSQRGAYILFTLIFLAALILLIILLVGLGYRSGNKVLLQNQANLVALAAIEGFVTETGVRPNQAPQQLNYQLKAQTALERANLILSKNTLKGIKAPELNNPNVGIGVLSHAGTPQGNNSAGEIELGSWFDKPTPGNDPCNLSNPRNMNPNYDMYPCFMRHHAPISMPNNSNANAVRVKLRNQSSNPIFAPIAGQIGYIEEETFAIMVPRCTANLVDISYSAVNDSHRALPAIYENRNYHDPNLPKDYYLTNPVPPFSGLFAFPNFGLNGPIDDGQCLNLRSDSPSRENFFSKLFWCQMPDVRNVTDRSQHFKSDYEIETTDSGQYYIDKYVSPEPFTRYLNSFNAAYRLIKGSLTPGDKSLLIGFNGGIASSVPPVGSGLTTEIDYLIQITNPANVIGTKTGWSSDGYFTTQTIYPNFLNENLIPKFSFDRNVSGTNLVKVLFDAASRISDRNNCEEAAKKSIIVATDGIGSCRPDIPNSNVQITGATSYTCADARPENSAALLQAYNFQETVLLNQIKQKLIDQRISLTVMLDGAGIGLHYLDVYNPNVSPDNDSDYLTFEEARSLGYGIASDKPFFRSNSKCPPGITPCTDELAISRQGEPGYQFRRPIATLGRIAFETGGMICPLLEPCTPSQCNGCGGASCYTSPPPGGVPILKDCARSAGSEQTCPFYGVSKSQQAALCARQAVGGNPFALRQPVTIIGP